MDKFRVNARQRLIEFLPRAMADEHLDESEKAELMGMLTSGVLTREDVREIFHDFLEREQGTIMADGQLSPNERTRCRAIVRELRIPREFLPPDMLWIIDET